MKFFLSLFLFGLSWLGSIFPNTDTPTLPQWEQQAIKYGEGDPELECLYREILFSIHQQEERQRNRINLLMHLEVLPHAELHAKERILNGRLADEYDLHAELNQTQFDTIKNDQTLKNLQKLEEEKGKRQKQDEDCGRGNTSVVEGLCGMLSGYSTSYTFSTSGHLSKDDQVIASLDNAACVSEEDIKNGRRKEKLQAFWIEKADDLFCDDPSIGTVHLIASVVDYRNDNFLKYLVSQGLDIKMDLSVATHIKYGDKEPYTILDYVDMKIHEAQKVLKDSTHPDIILEVQARIDSWKKYQTIFEKYSIQRLR